MPRFITTFVSTVAVLAVCAAAAPAKTRVAIGLGDQSAAVFGAKNFRALKVKKVRYFIRWDAMRVGYARRAADQYVRAAKRAHVRVFMHISTNDYRHRKAKLPSTRAYKRYVGNLVRRYHRMGVREFGVWNEANHYSEPTYKNPRRAAQYFHLMRGMCRTCTIVALDVLDQRGTASYIRRFYRALSARDRAAARLVGIHNYGDTNRFRTTGTRDIIRSVHHYNRSTRFWFTETGGIVKLGHSFKCSTSRAARALKYMFSLARRYRAQVSRLYAYNYFAPKKACTGFDSGLVTHGGKARRGYRVFKSNARHFTR